MPLSIIDKKRGAAAAADILKIRSSTLSSLLWCRVCSQLLDHHHLCADDDSVEPAAKINTPKLKLLLCTIYPSQASASSSNWKSCCCWGVTCCTLLGHQHQRQEQTANKQKNWLLALFSNEEPEPMRWQTSFSAWNPLLTSCWVIVSNGTGNHTYK